MDIRKAYRMLVVVLFFAFISLISRSIIYLILSVAIATMIFSLLSREKKLRKVKQNQQLDRKTDDNINLQPFLFVTTVVGALLIGYGSLYYNPESVFHHIVPAPSQMFLAIGLIILGFLIVLVSLYYILQESLNGGSFKKNSAKQAVICENCQTKNKPKHAFCFRCGHPLN